MRAKKVELFDRAIAKTYLDIPPLKRSPEQAEAIWKLQDALRCERSLYHFFRRAWEVLEPGTKFVGGWHIRAICIHLMALLFGVIRNLIINIPPRASKSLLCSVAFPAWAWIHFPHEQFLFSSYVHVLSIRDSRRCRDLIQSPWYQEFWGDKVQLVGDSNTLVRFDNANKGYRIATSVDGYNTGEGAGVIGYDDPNSVDDVFNENALVKVNNWFRRVMSTRLNDMRTGRRFIIQQRISELDLSGDVMERDKGMGRWVKLIIPMWFEPERRCRTGLVAKGWVDEWFIDHDHPEAWQDPRMEEGQLLCPARFGPDELASLRADLEAWDEAGQLQQRPAPAEGGIFKRDAWGFYYKRDLPVDAMAVCISGDLAFKGNKKSAYNVYQLWAYADGYFWLIDWRRVKLEYREMKADFLEFYETYPWVDAVLLEDAANAAALISDLQDEIPCLIAVPVEGDKENRARVISPIQGNGRILLPHPVENPRVKEFLAEANVFPNSRFKDQIDAAAQGINWLKNRGRRRRRKPARHRQIMISGL